MYKGLFFDSKKILPIYSPNIPIQIIWIPLESRIANEMAAQPGTQLIVKNLT